MNFNLTSHLSSWWEGEKEEESKGEIARVRKKLFSVYNRIQDCIWDLCKVIRRNWRSLTSWISVEDTCD